jgi:hypothetical protein
MPENAHPCAPADVVQLVTQLRNVLDDVALDDCAAPLYLDTQAEQHPSPEGDLEPHRFALRVVAQDRAGRETVVSRWLLTAAPLPSSPDS